MHSMPNGEQAQEQVQKGADSTEKSIDGQSHDDEEEEEESDESEDKEEEVDSPLCTERRSKQSHDLAGGCNKVVAPSTQVHKCTRTSTPEPSEKVAKHPKVAPSKSRKSLPKIKMDVPVASA